MKDRCKAQTSGSSPMCIQMCINAPALSLKRRIDSFWALTLVRMRRVCSTRLMKVLVKALFPDSSFMSALVHMENDVGFGGAGERLGDKF